MQPVIMNSRSESNNSRGVGHYARALRRQLGDKVVAIEPESWTRGVKGHLWEQCRLPTLVRGALLWSPGNTGPIAVKKQVVTIHDASTLDHPEWFTPKFARTYRILLKALAKRVRRIITVSTFSKERLLRHLDIDPDAVVVIHNGVDTDRYRPGPCPEDELVRRKLDLSRDFVLSVGSLEVRKNHARLIDAWSGASGKADEMELVIVGSHSDIFERPHLPSSARVRIVSDVADDDLPALYRLARLFVYPSLYEGFGLPPLEAMASGTPVLSSNRSSLPEVLSDAALLVDPTEPESIREGISELLEDSDRRDELRRKGLRHAATLTWERCASETWKALSDASS